MAVQALNPADLSHNPAFSQGVRIEGPGAFVVIGGQNGVDAHGAVVGDELGAQTARAFRNLVSVLDSAGATVADVVKLTVYLVVGNDAGAAFAAARDIWGAHACPVTVVYAAALGRPGFLIEIDALAFVPAS